MGAGEHKCLPMRHFPDIINDQQETTLVQQRPQAFLAGGGILFSHQADAQCASPIIQQVAYCRVRPHANPENAIGKKLRDRLQPP